ncbi:MAG: hypothetical protein R2719_13715 [Micropruina sp.]
MRRGGAGVEQVDRPELVLGLFGLADLVDRELHALDRGRLFEVLARPDHERLADVVDHLRPDGVHDDLRADAGGIADRDRGDRPDLGFWHCLFHSIFSSKIRLTH